MFIRLNNEKIKLDFNSGIKCSIEGPEKSYYVHVSEYVSGNDVPKYVEGYGIGFGNQQPQHFSLDIEFFMDFEISIFKFIDKVGLVNIYTHRYNDYGQAVKFILNTEDFEEADLWVQKVIEYKEKSGCNVILESQFSELNNFFEHSYNSKNITPYKTYRIGRYPKTSTDFRTVDERCEGLIWFGYWKKFWSYQHPRNWSILDSNEIANDILGL